MTIKEIAEFCKRTPRSVRNWVSKLQLQKATLGNNFKASYEKISRGISEKNELAMKTGIPADFNIDEVEAILNASTLSKDAVAILMNNARNGNVYQSNVNRDLAPISKMQNYLSPREIEIITSVVSLAVSKTIERLETRITSLEKTVGEQKQLPWNNEIDIRTRINVLVRKFATERNLDIKDVWLKLYKLFGYKTHTNPSVSARNRGMRIIDYIESEGQLDVLEKIAQGMMQSA